METLTVTGDISHKISLFRDGKQILCEPCFAGRRGITKNKREGDMATPAGTFEITAAFGFAPNPGSALPYINITPGTILVDDPKSRFYNQIVDASAIEPDFKTFEKMWELPEYKYGAIIDYNHDRTPGKGSGIFLHCAARPYTAGCVSADEAVVVRILKNLSPGAVIIIDAPA